MNYIMWLPTKADFYVFREIVAVPFEYFTLFGSPYFMHLT